MSVYSIMWPFCISVMALMIIPVVSYYPLMSQTIPWSGSVINTLNFPLLMMTMWIFSLSILASQQIKVFSHSPNKFLFIILTLFLLILVFFTCSNFLVLYITFESVLFPMFVLLVGWGVQPERFQAGSYLVLYTVSASLPLLAILMVLFNLNFHLSMTLAKEQGMFFEEASFWGIAMIFAFLVKFPVYGLHLWLPKAHVEAPVAGSMILAGVLLKLGVYGFMQLWLISGEIVSSIWAFLVSLGLMGSFYSSVTCVRQTDIKAMIAYSSISHMGVILSAITLSSGVGWMGASVMMVAHGICSSGLFAAANIIYQNTNTRSILLMKGLGFILPNFSFWWLILLMANMSLPPFLNLFGELLLMMSVLSINMLLVILLIMISFFVSVYSLLLYSSVVHGKWMLYMNLISDYKGTDIILLLSHIPPLVLPVFKLELFCL